MFLVFLWSTTTIMLAVVEYRHQAENLSRQRHHRGVPRVFCSTPSLALGRIPDRVPHPQITTGAPFQNQVATPRRVNAPLATGTSSWKAVGLEPTGEKVLHFGDSGKECMQMMTVDLHKSLAIRTAPFWLIGILIPLGLSRNVSTGPSMDRRPWW